MISGWKRKGRRCPPAVRLHELEAARPQGQGIGLTQVTRADGVKPYLAIGVWPSPRQSMNTTFHFGAASGAIDPRPSAAC